MLLYTLPYLVNDLVAYMKAKGSPLEYKKEIDNVTALSFTLTSNQFISEEVVSLRLLFKHVYLNLIDVGFYARRENETSTMGYTTSQATPSCDQEGVHLHTASDSGSGESDKGSILKVCGGDGQMETDIRRTKSLSDVCDTKSKNEQTSTPKRRPGQLHQNSTGRSKSNSLRR